MNYKLLAAVMSAAGFTPPLKRCITVCADPQHTLEVMATRKQIAGMKLELLEKSAESVGHLATGAAFMVDVDHRDIVK